MAEKRRFASRGLSWSNGIITLDREGQEFDTETDAELIEIIVNSGVNGGGYVLELPTKEQQKASATAIFQESEFFKQTVEKAVVEAVKVEPIQEMVNEEAELADIAEQKKLRQEQAEAEAQAKAERKAKFDEFFDTNAVKGGKKPKSENKKKAPAKGKKAKAE